VGTDTSGHADDVFVAFLVDRQFNTFAPVYVRNGGALLMRTGDSRDFTEPNRLSIFDRDRHVRDVMHVGEATQRTHDVLGVAVAQTAARRVDILLSDRLVDHGDGNAERRQSRLVDLDPDLLFQAAGHLGRRDPLQRLDLFLEYVLGDVAQVDQRRVTPQSDPQNRVESRVVLQEQRCARFIG